MKQIGKGMIAWRVALALVLGALLASCGGGGSVPFSGVTIRPLSEDFTVRRAVAYSPFRTSASEADLPNEVITKEQIKEDLNLLLAAGFRAIRLFSSSDKVARQTLEVIRDEKLNIRVQLGAFVLSGNDAESRAEMARCVTLANTFPDIVLAVSVGNETMVSWAFNRIEPALMAEYIRTVRDQIKQPVTTDDNYAFWASAPTIITDQIDFAALHTYPNLDTWFDPTRWDWKNVDVEPDERAVAMMDGAIAEAKRQYQEARDFLDRKGLSYIPIIIGETGWNAVDVGRQRFRAHPVNQKMYLDRLEAWAAEGRAGNGPKQVFYFEAFDEPWKQGDDKWGLFNVQRQARFAVQAINPPGAVFGSATWVFEPVNPANDANGDGIYTGVDATYFQEAEVKDPGVTASTYTLLSDLPPGPDEVRPTGLRWDAFDGNTAGYATVSGTHGPGDAPNALRVTPSPARYGWGLLLQSATGENENLSRFETSGSLTFQVSTTYPGKIEIGIATDTQEREGQEAYLQIGPGDYGYCNTGAWCTVSIPLSAFAAVNPKVDLSLVLLRFVIADRYAFTGKPDGSAITTPIFLDAIRWSR